MKNEENRYKREWVYVELGLTRKEAREKVDKEIEEMKKPEWQCKRCGICCRFILIPVAEPIDLETASYLNAHGIAYDGEKLIISAVCQHLALEYRKEGESGCIYKCKIHENKFANCRLSGEKGCKEAKKAWKLLIKTIKDGG